MQFNSITFLIFFLIVLAVFYSFQETHQRKALLLGASYLFYAAWNPPFIFLLFLSTYVDWVLAKRIAIAANGRSRRLLLIGSLCSNLGLLGYFKYGGFILENFSALSQYAGISYSPPSWSVVLPVGISFYTFQSLSYTIDVYRRNVKPSNSFLDFALFVSFFPQLVAGPIVRAGDFLPQCITVRGATRDQLGWGFFLLLFGLFSKVVLADSIFAPFVDSFYAAPSQHGAAEAGFAIMAFSAQIFFDFSAYSTCAVGAALCLGFVLPDNFRAPYAALGFSDFWRRWHVSLSTWMRDYVYIAFGGNRGGRLRTTLNLMVTMLLGGLWHGASWQFVIWGGIHGALLGIEHGLRRLVGDIPLMTTRIAKIIVWFFTFSSVSFAWVFFRAPDLRSALEVFVAFGRESAGNPVLASSMPHILTVTVAMILWQAATRTSTLEDHFRRLGLWLRLLLATGALLSFAFAEIGNEHAFIYFQF